MSNTEDKIRNFKRKETWDRILTVSLCSSLYIMFQQVFIACHLYNTVPLNLLYWIMNKIKFYCFILLCHGYFLIAAAKSRLRKVKLYVFPLVFPYCSFQTVTVQSNHSQVSIIYTYAYFLQCFLWPVLHLDMYLLRILMDGDFLKHEYKESNHSLFVKFLWIFYMNFFPTINTR